MWISNHERIKRQTNTYPCYEVDAVGDNNVGRVNGNKLEERVDGVALVEVVHSSGMAMNNNIQYLPCHSIHFQCWQRSFFAETQESMNNSK